MKYNGYVYGLVDPRTNKIMYVGFTYDPLGRYRGHLSDRSSREKFEWIEDLRRLGMLPIFRVLKRGLWDGDEAGAEEAAMLVKVRAPLNKLKNKSGYARKLNITQRAPADGVDPTAFWAEILF